MHLSQAVLAVALAASSAHAAAINPRDLAERDPLFSSILSWKGNYEQDWNSLYFLAGKQNVYDLCCSIKPKTVTQYRERPTRLSRVSSKLTLLAAPQNTKPLPTLPSSKLRPLPKSPKFNTLKRPSPSTSPSPRSSPLNTPSRPLT